MVLSPKAWWTYLRSRRPNFHVVAPGQIFRSATPTPENLAKWKTQYQLRTWVDLRMPKDYIDDPSFFAAQCAAAREREIKRISLPLDDFGIVSDEQVHVALDLMGDSTKWPMLWACKGGRHRAGLMIALFRVRFQQWTGERAYDEAKDVGGYYASGHRTFDTRFRQLLGLLLVLLMAVPAFGQTTHPFIQPDQAAAAVVKESLTTESAVKVPAIAYGADHRFDRSFWIASTLWAAASTADIRTTLAALERGGIERNPIFASNGRRSLRVGANIAAVVGTWSYAAWLEHRGHRKLARLVLIAGAVLRTTAAVWNNTRARR